MGDLISRSALKQALRKCQIESLIAHTEEKNVFDIINEQPTAYDVEKVVAELDKYPHGYLNVETMGDICDIVKRGGVE